MDLLELIKTRRSIRKYTGEKIEQDKIDLILEAAMLAPSAVNKQPWEFIVVDDKELMTKITEFHPHAMMLKDADKAIVVCGNKEKAHAFEYLMCDLSAATENILLAAHALGIGAVWLGIYPREPRMEGLQNLFNIPDNILPFAVISLGDPAETKEIPDRFDKQKVHDNGW